jgi:hypothetical protein
MQDMQFPETTLNTTTPIDPSKDRAGAIAAVPELINERRKRKQEQVDFLKQKFRCAEWPKMRTVIVAAQQAFQSDRALNAFRDNGVVIPPAVVGLGDSREVAPGMVLP